LATVRDKWSAGQIHIEIRMICNNSLSYINTLVIVISITFLLYLHLLTIMLQLFLLFFAVKFITIILIATANIFRLMEYQNQVTNVKFYQQN
jgi:hypothetical protein